MFIVYVFKNTRCIFKNTDLSKQKRDYGHKASEFKSLIIFLDEADIYMHPEWNQRFINAFLRYLEIKFRDISVQVVMTINSPIIAGNILAFNKVRDKQIRKYLI
ncbi:MAG: hypothetical protein RR500_08485 [Bacilli bacterium]